MTNMKASWKTSLAGVGMILTGLLALVHMAQTGHYDATSATTAFGGISGGIGLIFARDHNVSSEDAGVSPAQVQAVKSIAQNTGATMTKVVGLVLLTIGLSAGYSAKAQSTNSTNGQTVIAAMPATNLLGLLGMPSLGAGWSAFAQGFVDDIPYVSNSIVSFDTGVLYNKSDTHGKVGAYAAITVPISQQADVGLGGFYQNRQFGNAEVNLTLGTTVSNLFGVGKYIIGPVFAFASSGPDYDFAKGSDGKAIGVGSYNAAGFKKKITVGKSLELDINVGTENISCIPGIGWFGGFTLTKHF